MLGLGWAGLHPVSFHFSFGGPLNPLWGLFLLKIEDCLLAFLLLLVTVA
jgi:hypothetical protein